MRPTAVVMNMFYTGLGIARSLGERGIPVIGLSAQRGIYGNFTRYAKIAFCPDSRRQPEQLADYLVRLGQDLGGHSILFPTRDDDVLFLDRFRERLSKCFNLVVPPSPALHICLDKMATYKAAVAAGVPTPKCWLVENERELEGVVAELPYPCVAKPVSSHDWRQGQNWALVGARKAFVVSNEEQLRSEYRQVSHAGPRLLIQELVPGGDDCLLIAACYLNRESRMTAAFNTQKLLQSPEGFGTGCIVQSAQRPELFEPSERLLKSIKFTGIAEVEYKWDAACSAYRLIEVNPRPWDQHRLGQAAGVDLAYLAYCEQAGIDPDNQPTPFSPRKWVAEDALTLAALEMLWKRDPRLRKLPGLLRGKRIYAIWSAKDPLPWLAYMFSRFLPGLVRSACTTLVSAVRRAWARTGSGSAIYERPIERDNPNG
jgi:D-aspartate ligase